MRVCVAVLHQLSISTLNSKNSPSLTPFFSPSLSLTSSKVSPCTITNLSTFALSSPSITESFATSFPSPFLVSMVYLQYYFTNLSTPVHYSNIPIAFTVNKMHPHYIQIGTRTAMTSYCPIVYTLAVGKIFKNNEMSKLLTQVEHLLHSSMHGFLPGLRTQTNCDLRLFYVELTNLLRPLSRFRKNF